MPKSLIKRVSESKLIIFLLLIFGLGFFLRVYRIDSLLGFYYDQGRDALIIQEFLQRGKLFLIGPATGGIEGFFRGPWYYWLITPFYFLGKGNPVCPAVFLVLTVVFSLFLLYKLGEKLSGEGTGLIALLIGSFSYYLVNASRWLSNPTPMFLVSVLLVYSLFLILEGKKLAWLLLAFLLGMGMQFGGLAELFYFHAVLVFAIWQRKNFPGFKILILSFFLLCLVFAPQVFFDIRHQGILSTAIKKFLFEKESFRISFWVVLKVRTVFYFNLFASKIFPFNKILSGVTFVVVFLNAWRKRKEIFSNKYFVTLSLLLGAPLIGMVFFKATTVMFTIIILRAIT